MVVARLAPRNNAPGSPGADPPSDFAVATDRRAICAVFAWRLTPIRGDPCSVIAGRRSRKCPKGHTNERCDANSSFDPSAVAISSKGHNVAPRVRSGTPDPESPRDIAWRVDSKSRRQIVKADPRCVRRARPRQPKLFSLSESVPDATRASPNPRTVLWRGLVFTPERIRIRSPIVGPSADLLAAQSSSAVHRAVRNVCLGMIEQHGKRHKWP